MDIVTIDYESFYGADYTLSKLTTEAYVRDPRFETILMSVKINDAPAYWVPKPEVASHLAALNLQDKAMLCHHAHFDALIANHHYDIRPKLLLCTLGMGRALHGANGRLSLEKLAERYGLPPKGHEVNNVKDMRYADFTVAGLARYGQYSIRDADICYWLAKQMMPHFSKEELQIHDAIIRMFTEPGFVLDVLTLEAYEKELGDNKIRLLLEAGVMKDDVMSNAKFADVLRSLGVEPPMKISPSWLKKQEADRDPAKQWVYAFAKNDAAMQALQEHEDEAVQAVVEARLGNKTTIAEKGARRLIDMAGRGNATVYLKYSGASGTHRLSGGDKFNWQSMKRGSPLRDAVMAPEGKVCVVGDSSNIEARIVDWLAGQDDMVEVYRRADRKEGPDVYCVMAERIYKRPINKADDPLQRQMGKVCIAEGTPVLCYTGWKPIEQVAAGDYVWDGEEWVWAAGSVCNGFRPTLKLCGVSLTPDHQVWSGTHWWEARYLVHDESLRCRALATAAANLPSLATSKVRPAAVWQRLLPSVTAAGRNILWTCITSKISAQSAATYAPSRLVQARANCIGGMPISCPTTSIARDCSTGCLLPSGGAISRAIAGTSTMAAGALQWLWNGETTAPHFYGTPLPYQGGTTLHWTWTGATTRKDTSPAIFGLSPDRQTQPTSAKSERCKTESVNWKPRLRVYDVLNAGPRNRFTVMTDEGPMIVHNCKLGLGFGMGDEKFVAAVRGQAKDQDGKPIVIDRKFSKEVVTIYRDAHPQVQKLWKRGGDALRAIAEGRLGVPVDYRGVVKTCKDGLVMPGGLKILYPDLKFTKSADSWGGEWSFWNGKERERIYGAKVIENCIAEGTDVLTQRGWVPIEFVRMDDKVHDGVEFVNHGGTIFKSVQDCVSIDGVYMTPDHEVLTDEGWKPALEKPEPFRPTIRDVAGTAADGQRRSEDALGIPVRLRKESREGRCESNARIEAGGNAELWVRDQGADVAKHQDAWHVQPSGVLGMAQHERSLSIDIASGVQKLRRAWYHGVQAVAGVIREFLGGHGVNVPTWAYAGTGGQRQGLHTRELRLGNDEGAGAQPAQWNRVGPEGNLPADRYPSIDAVLPTASRATTYRVYDIMNAGPRRRFVVRGNNGPFIVHNCVQCLARIIVFNQCRITQKETATIAKWAHSVHDEGVFISAAYYGPYVLGRLLSNMRIAPDWAPDLPLNSEGGFHVRYGHAKS